MLRFKIKVSKLHSYSLFSNPFLRIESYLNLNTKIIHSKCNNKDSIDRNFKQAVLFTPTLSLTRPNSKMLHTYLQLPFRIENTFAGALPRGTHHETSNNRNWEVREGIVEYFLSRPRSPRSREAWAKALRGSRQRIRKRW